MKEDILFYSEVLEDDLDPANREDQHMVRDGLSLYQQGMVSIIKTSEDFIEGKVQDLIPYEAVLDLLHVREGSCSCDAGSMCSHRMALFFTAYASHGSVSDWVSNWNGRKRQAPIQVETVRNAIIRSTVLENDYQAWKSFVEETFSRQIAGRLELQPYMMEGAFQNYHHELKSKEPLERNWRSFYQFAADLTTFFSILSLLENDELSEQMKRVFTMKAADLAEELHGRVVFLSHQTRPFSFDSIIDGLTADSQRLLEGGPLLHYERIELYRELWTYMLTKSSTREAEAARLEERMAFAGSRLSYTIASIHLAVLTRRDDEARILLQQLGPEECPYLFYWLELFQSADTPVRAVPYIEFLLGNADQYLESIGGYYQCMDFVRTFTRPVLSLCRKLKRNDLLERFFKQMLPYSYWNYSTFLFEQEQFKKWVELQIYTGTTIDTIGQDRIKAVVAADPALILPLYHHAVQQSVSMKNRSAYKQAVRYMKKMRTIYKKMKQEPAFAAYTAYISDNTKRLRAFQEELQRGKLVDVE